MPSVAELITAGISGSSGAAGVGSVLTTDAQYVPVGDLK